MGIQETVQSAGSALHQLIEARSALGDVNLLHMLQDLGHPYGLILGNLSQASSLKIPRDDALSSISLFSLLDSLSGNPIISSSSEIPQRGGYQGPGNGSPRGMGSPIIVGASVINIAHYHGKEPFLVKRPSGEPLIEIQPESPLAFLHLNQQAGELRKMSPLEKVQTMARSLIDLFGLIDNQDLFKSFNPKQQAVLTAARSAVIVGISHLVPIFRRRTGLPFWKLDVLPQAIQQLHRLDSQAVSNQFGGHRQVRVEDVEMMVITPQMRQQLAAAYA